MPNKVEIPVKDFSGEDSTISIYVASPSDAEITAFYTTVNSICVGTLGGSFLVNKVPKNTGATTLPTDPWAQREIKWICKIYDATVDRTYEFSIPCADISKVSGNTEYIDLTTGLGSAFKTAVDAIAKSWLGNAALLQSVKFQGRNT